MPLSELLYMLAGKVDSSSTSQDMKKKEEDDPPPPTPLSSLPENDVVELVWENGQVQPSKGSRTQVSQSHKIRGIDIASGTNPRLVKFGYVEPVSPQVPLSVPALEIGLNHDDDLVPWLNFPVDEPLQHEYCSEISQGMSGVTVNASSSLNDFASSHRSSGCHFSQIQNGLSSDKERFRSSVDIEAARPGTSSGHLYASQSHQIQTSHQSCTSRVWGDAADLPRVATASRDVMSKDSTRFASSRGGFTEMTTQNQASAASNTNFQRMNFSHFARPPALVKANAKTVTSMAGSRLERIPCTTNPSEPSPIDSCSGLQQQTNSHCHLAASSQLGPDLLKTRPAIEPGHCELQKAVSQEDDSKNDNNRCGTFDESNTKGLPDCDKTAEPVVAPSVCSGNSVERASDNLRHNSKRKHHDVEESEGPSEDIEEESMGAKIAAPARATGAKRSRAAEVHNLSERRRRDRINEKMRALQELIPNCNKVDKASMLDEAIEYLKTLQLQVQIMSMGAGLYMPSMMLQPGMPLVHAAHMARLSNANVGMGMAMGFGMGMPDMNGRSSACSMIQAPPMSGSHFPGLGFGLSVPGLPVPYPCAPFVSVCGGPMINTYMEMNAHGLAGLRDKLQSTPVSISKESILNANLQGMQNNVANGSIHHTSAQGQATKECCEQSVRIETTFHAMEVTSNDSLDLTNVNGPAEPLVATER